MCAKIEDASQQWRGMDSNPAIVSKSVENRMRKWIWGFCGPGRAEACQPTVAQHTNKRIIYWRRKEGEAEWSDERRGNTVHRQWRVLASISNIHSQRVTIPPLWKLSDVQPVHMVPLRKPRAVLFKKHSVNTACFNQHSYNFAIKQRHERRQEELTKPTVELSSASLTTASRDEFLLMPWILY